jgi:hypothetical protein
VFLLVNSKIETAENRAARISQDREGVFNTFNKPTTAISEAIRNKQQYPATMATPAVAGTTPRITRANALPVAESPVTRTVDDDIPIPQRHEQRKFVAKLLENHMTILRQIAVLRAARHQTSNGDLIADNILAPGACWWMITGHDKYQAQNPNSRPITLWEQLGGLGIDDDTFGSWFKGEKGFTNKRWQRTFAKRWEGRGLRVARFSSAMFVTIDNDLAGSLPDTRHLMPSPDSILDHAIEGDWGKCLVLQREALKLPNMPMSVAQALLVCDADTPDTRSRKRRRVSAGIATEEPTRVRNPSTESLPLAIAPAPAKNTPAPKEKAPAPKEAPPFIPPEAPKEKTPAPQPQETTPSLPNLVTMTTVDPAIMAKYPVLAKYGVPLAKDDFLAKVDRDAICRELWSYNIDHKIPNELTFYNGTVRKLVTIVPRKPHLKDDTANFVRSANKTGMVEDILDAIVVDDKKAAATLLCHYLAKQYPEEYMKPVPIATEVLEKEAKETVRRERRESGISFDDYQLARWESRFKGLVAYQAKHEHCNAPSREETGVGKFVSQQRTAYREKRLSEERIKRLESIGFTWKVGSSPSSDIRFFKAIAAKHHFPQITAREALLLSGYTEEESRGTSKMGNVRDKARLFDTKTAVTKQQKEIAVIITQLTAEGGPMAVFGSSPYYNAFIVQRNPKAKATSPDSDNGQDDYEMSSGYS